LRPKPVAVSQQIISAVRLEIGGKRVGSVLAGKLGADDGLPQYAQLILGLQKPHARVNLGIAILVQDVAEDCGVAGATISSLTSCPASTLIRRYVLDSDHVQS
jgi:hypothetical protein